MPLLVIVLGAVVAALWQRVRSLDRRIETLEFAGVPSTVSPWVPSPTSPRDAGSPIAEMPFAPIPEPSSPRQHSPVSVSVRRARSEPAPAVAEPAAEGRIMAEATMPLPERGSWFEDVFGRRLPIWAGGVTLAVAGFLIVKYSIEAGLLSPLVRVVTGLLFGTGLIAGAEAALRRESVVGDPRVRQALAGAGVATLYATALAAANLYHLIGPATAFVGMALVTGLAGGLSIRFGAPSAVLGLVGGLAAPALVGSSQPDVPLLTLYLAFAVGGLCALGRRQRWWWLGASALAGGFGWGALLILSGTLGLAGALSVGLYTLALAMGLPLLLTDDRRGMVRLAGSVMGCAQLAALVAIGGFAPLHWGLFGLISVAIVWLSRRETLFADVPALGLGVAVLLAFAWPSPTALDIGLLLAAITAIFAVPAAFRVWRGDARMIDAPSVAIGALTIGVLPILQFPDTNMWGTALLGAALAAGVAMFGWQVPSRREDSRFATLTIAAAALLALAGVQACATWTWAPGAASIACGLYLLGMRAEDRRLERGGAAFALATIILLAIDDGAARLIGDGAPGKLTGLVTWVIPAAVAIVLGWHAGPTRRRVFQSAAVLIGYGAAAQVVPAFWLPTVPALIFAGLAATRRTIVLPALAVAALLMAGWAAEPLARWLEQGTISIFGIPVGLGNWPAATGVALRVGLPGLALLLAATLAPLPIRAREGGLAIAGVALTITAHIAWKQVFAIVGPAEFVQFAMTERTLWEMLLAAAAAAAWLRGGRRLSIGLGSASLLHFLWFTGMVANPLFVMQQVWIWLVASYGMAGALVWFAPRALPNLRRGRDGLLMALVVGGGFTLLRQAMHSPLMLAAGTDPGEQIARSLLAIVLAGGFLWTGIAARSRDWRIASLVLMLIAVVKVFLFDAAGLDGLARIGSFAALGFSLIGVGWLYSRYLPDEAR